MSSVSARGADPCQAKTDRRTTLVAVATDVNPGSCPSEDGYFLAAPARADGLPQRFEAWLMAEIAGLQRSPRVDRGLASMGDEP